MQRDDNRQESDFGDPTDYLREQIMNQMQPVVPEPVNSPVYAPPETPPPPDTGGSSFLPGDDDPSPRNYSDPPAQSPTPPPDSGSVGAGIPWNPGASAPSSAPPGYHWDANMANFVQDAPPQAPAGPSTSRPGGGTLTDPAFAAAYVAWAGQQPGVNPSVKNDPGYWIGRFTSGAFGNDQQYALQRMMQPEGPPEGAGGAAPQQRPTTPGQTSYLPSAPSAGPSFSSLSGGGNGPQGVWNSEFVAQLRQLLMSRLNAASQPVDPNSETISAPLNAARDEATRGSEKERTALAENLYAQGGLNTDAISQKVQQSGEKNAQGLSSLRATLISREMAQKQEELKSLLQLAIQSGDAESAQAIQLQLAELTAQVQREGIGADMAKYAAYLNALASQGVMA